MVKGGGREPFIGPQASGAFDSKFQWMLPYPVVKEDGEIFYYYSYVTSPSYILDLRVCRVADL